MQRTKQAPLLQLASMTGELPSIVEDGFHHQEQETNLQSRSLDWSLTERIMLLLRSQLEVSPRHAFMNISETALMHPDSAQNPVEAMRLDRCHSPYWPSAFLQTCQSALQIALFLSALPSCRQFPIAESLIQIANNTSSSAVVKGK